MRTLITGARSGLGKYLSEQIESDTLNRSDEFHGLSIAGPKSRELLQKIIRENISKNSSLKFIFGQDYKYT